MEGFCMEEQACVSHINQGQGMAKLVSRLWLFGGPWLGLECIPVACPFWLAQWGGWGGASTASNPAHVHVSVRIHHCRAEWWGRGRPLSSVVFFGSLWADHNHLGILKARLHNSFCQRPSAQASRKAVELGGGWVVRLWCRWFFNVERKKK